MPQLKTRSISVSAISPWLLEPAEDRRARPGAEVDAGAHALGQHARHVAVETAAGDVHDALDR